MSITEYREKFKELFEKLEEEHGVCSEVRIEHKSEYFYTVPYQVSNIDVSISF